MKKMTIAGVAVAAMAALSLISCEKQALQPERHPVSFELNIDNPGTKMALSAESGGLKATWVVGDKVAVTWGSEAEQYEEFEVAELKDDGRTAVFTNASSALPTSGNVTVGIYYPYISYDSSYGGWTPSILYSNYGYGGCYFSGVTPTLANAGKLILYGAWNIAVTDGVFPAVSMQQLNSLVKIPSGTSTRYESSKPALQLTNVYTLCFGTNNSYNVITGGTGAIGYKKDQSNLSDYANASTKKLTNDVYLPVFPGTYTGVQLVLGDAEYLAHRSVFSLGDKTIEAGKVYDISGHLSN